MHYQSVKKMRPIFYECVSYPTKIEDFADEFTIAFSNPYDYELAPYDGRKLPGHSDDILLKQLQTAMQRLYNESMIQQEQQQRAQSQRMYQQSRTYVDEIYRRQFQYPQYADKLYKKTYPEYDDYKVQPSMLTPMWNKETQEQLEKWFKV